MVAVAIVLGNRFGGGGTVDNFEVPGVESQQAVDLLKEQFPQRSGATAMVVFHADSGSVTDADAAAGIAGTVLLGLIFVITRGSGGWLFGIGPGPLFGIVFWGLAIAGLIWLIREGTKGNPPESFNDRPSPSSAPPPRP